MTPFQIFVLIVAVILQVAMAPKSAEGRKAPTIDDVDLPQCDEGTPQIVVFGDVWIEGWTVLSFGDFSTDPIKGKS